MTSQQIAEKLARQIANDYCDSYDGTIEEKNALFSTILSVIPLTELIEVAKVGKLEAKVFGVSNTFIRALSDLSYTKKLEL